MVGRKYKEIERRNAMSANVAGRRRQKPVGTENAPSGGVPGKASFKRTGGGRLSRKAARLSGGDYKRNGYRVQVMPDEVLADDGAFKREYLRMLTRYVPMVSTGVWVWENLTATEFNWRVTGTDSQKKIERVRGVMDDISERLNPFPWNHSNAMYLMVQQFYRMVYMYGRVASQVTLDANGKSVAGVSFRDPFKVRMTADQRIYETENYSEYYEINPKLYFYYGQEATMDNPYGFAMAESAQTLVEMGDGLLRDMKSYTANAGVPRLHIKIEQPEREDFEDAETYRKRISEYFNSTVEQFGELTPDDNIYTWDDVSVAVAGGRSAGSVLWKTDRQIIDEEIITAFHLFPWVMAKSFSTTKNWVRSQFDLLLSTIETNQSVGKGYLEWITNMELSLKGIEERVRFDFRTPRDPVFKETAEAEKVRIRNVRDKVLSGFISPEEGANELGYQKMYDRDRIYESKNSEGCEDGHASGGGDIDEFVEYAKRIEEKMDDLSGNVSEGQNMIRTMAGTIEGGKK
jgi:hypothetical protein